MIGGGGMNLQAPQLQAWWDGQGPRVWGVPCVCVTIVDHCAASYVT